MASTPVNRESSSRQALILGLAVAVFAAVFALLPEGVRPLNFALFGAIGLFVAARVGFWPGVAIMLGSKLTCDMTAWLLKGMRSDELPMISVYASFALYAILGWALLRKNNSAVRIGLTATTASLAFFLVSNFFSWLNQSLPYPYTLAGLGECYWNALPFYRGTFVSDLLFTGVLFAAHTAMVRITAPRAVAEEVRS